MLGPVKTLELAGDLCGPVHIWRGAGQATNSSTGSNVASAKREIALRAVLEACLKPPSARAELAGTDGGWQERSPGRDLLAEPGESQA